MSRLALISCRPLSIAVHSNRCSNQKSILTRQYCQNVNVPKPQVTATFSGPKLFRNERKPTNFDKKVLVWAGRFKKESDIPTYISGETLAAARNNMRIKVCMTMIVGTVLGCIAMVISGKKALREDRTLLQRNIEKKAKWREEAAQDQQTSIKSD
uniref:Protein FAM162B n=1 Tax=Leptobrachium leishanense TaxID=445787 RepID=A0A8C5WFN2_9ANUR